MDEHTFKLTLQSVVIACRNDDQYRRICRALDDRSSRQSAIEKKIGIQYGSRLSDEALAALGFTEDDEELTRDIVVISTLPFAVGYVDHKTEIIIVKFPKQLVVRADSQRRRSPPTVSHFLAQYNSSGVKQRGAVLNVKILDEETIDSLCKMEPSVDLLNSLIIGLDLAQDFQVMSGGFLMVKMQSPVAGIRRCMHVYVHNDFKDRNAAYLSQIAWNNLGGKLFYEDKELKINVKKKSALPSTSSLDEETPTQSSTSLQELSYGKVLQAQKVTLVPVKQVTSFPEDLSTSALKEYFSIDRYLCIGDVFFINCESYNSCTKGHKKLMKVARINGLDKSTDTFKINQYSALFEGMAVNGYVLPCSDEDGLKIGQSFSSTRQMCIKTLKPFVMHEWSPTPLPFMLLSGPEGSGKALVVQQVAQLLQCNYIEANCVNLVADTINSTETRIKELMTQTQERAPAVLLLRNIHLLTKDELNNQENPRISQTIQTELESAMNSSRWPILVIGTCDELKTVSEGLREIALQEIVFHAPGIEERFHMLEELSSHVNLHPTVSLNYFADHSAGFLYGDLKALVTHAQRIAVARGMKLCKAEIGYVDEDILKESKVFVTSDDFNQSLGVVQSLQSLELGAPKIPQVKWSDIGGLESVKADILDTIQLPLKHPSLMSSNMKRSGILLYGPPGTGKTLLAKAVATECSLNFFSVKGPELINMYVGQSEENVRQVFHKARSASPCVIFFDELDSLAPNRGRSGDSGGVMDRVVSSLLTELDGLHKNLDVFVIGATNRPDLIDPALLRPGRFDKLVFVGLSSNPSDKLTVLKALTRKFDLEPDCNLEEVSQRLPANLTGADLYSLSAEAMTYAIKRQIDRVQAGVPIDSCKLKVCHQDFIMALEDLVPSLTSEELQRYEKVRQQFSKPTRT